MSIFNKNSRTPLLAALVLSVAAISGCASMMGKDSAMKVNLSGAQEVPANMTAASGVSTVMVGADKSISGSITTMGITATAAHVHLGAPGKNGPVSVPMTKTADNTWSVAPGAKLTDEQYAAYQAGNLYVNVHSAAFPGGEIRAQLK
jgi:hypothetical protein